MISVYQLKPAFQRRLQPLLTALYDRGVTANQLTGYAILLSFLLGGLLSMYAIYSWVLLLLPIGLLIRMALNALDGMMARQYNMQSQLGEVMNEIGDILSDLAIILPLAIIPDLHSWVIVAFAVMVPINEFSGLMGKALGGERRYEGPMGKSDRALLLGIIALLLYFWPPIAAYANGIFAFAALLMLLGSFFRLKHSLK